MNINALVSRQFVDMSRVRIEFLQLFLSWLEVGNNIPMLRPRMLLSKVVAEFSTSLDEEGISKHAFELIFAFDEVISNGHKEDVTVTQVKQYCEMESHEERLHKAELERTIIETKKAMQLKALEIEKNKLERGKMVKGGYSSLQSMGIMDGGFGNDTMIPDGNDYGRGSGIGLSTDVNKSTAVSAPSKGTGMKLGRSQKGNQFLESLKAEGEVI
uniref:Coatomer subunit delta n=1 Tax=Tanacetum cinerariifolium TaxID=118510 RepID=A0A699HBA0_TANCI|nr:coatomer subunit delta-like [Tanacetum cinerariifolium]